MMCIRQNSFRNTHYNLRRSYLCIALHNANCSLLRSCLHKPVCSLRSKQPLYSCPGNRTHSTNCIFEHIFQYSHPHMSHHNRQSSYRNSRHNYRNNCPYRLSCSRLCNRLHSLPYRLCRSCFCRYPGMCLCTFPDMYFCSFLCSHLHKSHRKFLHTRHRSYRCSLCRSCCSHWSKAPCIARCTRSPLQFPGYCSVCLPLPPLAQAPMLQLGLPALVSLHRPERHPPDG